MHGLQLQLHFLAHLQVQRAERLVKEEDIRLIDDGPGDGDPLLLPAGQRGDPALLKSFQIHHFQHIPDLLPDLMLRQMLQVQSERDIIIDIQVREQRIPLKHRIDRSFVGRKLADILAV